MLQTTVCLTARPQAVSLLAPAVLASGATGYARAGSATLTITTPANCKLVVFVTAQGGPWPNEARIKTEMCAGVTRGFCSATSLTDYIWGYLGNPAPATF
jgi:hypothetical protein